MKSILAMFAVVFSLSLGAEAYLAPLDLGTMVREAEVVALVEVTSKSWHPEEKHHRRQAQLKVLHAFKGTSRDAQLTVTFGRGWSCGSTSYRPGQSWLVFLDRDGQSKVYVTYHWQYGQMEPLDTLLSRVQQIVAPGSKTPPTIKAGEPGVKTAKPGGSSGN